MTRVLITGGPTRAYLDDVRFLSNYSSGALAYELCCEALKKSLQISLVTGPTCQGFSRLAIETHLVDTAQEMLDAVILQCEVFRPQVVVFAAAVLDFVPAVRESGKMSSDSNWSVTLRPFPKIIDEVGRKFPQIARIGFKLQATAEHDDPQAEANNLRVSRKLEGLCLNYLDEISGEKHPAYFSKKDGSVEKLQTKKEIARALVRYIPQLSI